MKTLLILAFTTAITASGLVAHSAVTTVSAARTKVKRTMKPFKSEQDVTQFFRRIAERQRVQQRLREQLSVNAATATVNVTSTDEESITNVQHAGVDEGGIVKVHGDHLVILRRGRLFTIAVGDRTLKPISAVDAFGPDLDPKGSWYDEMLVARDTIAVIGYSYERGGTEVGLFDINDEGRIAYRSTYHLRSNDYYSSRNFASRLIGSKLIFYSPMHFYLSGDSQFEPLPAVRKWNKESRPKDFRRIVPASRIYRPEIDFYMDDGVTVHSVTVCDLANRGFDCQATSVIGPPGRVFYVSPDSVYVWATSWGHGSLDKHLLFRLPLDGSGPSALAVTGSPVDQFSFLESADQYLNVLVRSEGKGDGMWAAEVAEGDIALMRIPIASFSDGSDSVPRSNYRPLKKAVGDSFQNRFIGDYLIYGTGSGWGYPQNPAYEAPNVFIVNWRDGSAKELTLPHGVDRIEQLGSDAVIVGADSKDLHFSSVKLGSWPEVISRYTRKDASQGETRSHGFFYKPDSDSSGTLGLPISTAGRAGYRQLFESSASILFLRNDSLHFREIGELGSEPEKAVDDNCRASCVDWYGNARPIFLRGRLFALLGYELVEGRFDTGRMQEVRRVNFAPGKQNATR